jgi:hypothetical protein
MLAMSEPRHTIEQTRHGTDRRIEARSGLATHVQWVALTTRGYNNAFEDPSGDAVAI